MFNLIIQLILGLIYANAGEWLMHKYILHARGQNRHSFWAYHWHEHHTVCAKNAMLDPGYRSLILTAWNAQTKKLAVLTGIVLLHVPLLILSPLFTGTVYASLMIYDYKHRKAHLNPTWAKRHLRCRDTGDSSYRDAMDGKPTQSNQPFFNRIHYGNDIDLLDY